jgi:crossover junction endodeoxyribonuclease RuvC
MPRVLGIDPGLNITGYAVLETAAGGPLVCEAGVVRGKSRNSLTSRLLEIHSGVAEVIAQFKPQVVAIEQLYSHYERPRTAILMGHSRGVICLAATMAGIPVVNYAATQVKKLLTGNGHASKSQVQHAVKFELKLATLPEPADVSDALAIALCHYYLNREWAALARHAPTRKATPSAVDSILESDSADEDLLREVDSEADDDAAAPLSPTKAAVRKSPARFRRKPS